METTARQKNQGHRVSIFSALAGMLVAFLAGTYVGLHPAWIPLTGPSYDFSQPPVKARPGPASEPTEHHSAQSSQTQPSVPGTEPSPPPQ